MVHAFCGVTVTFIDDNWILQEHVLDLLPLLGDHSGAAVAKLVFTSLSHRKMDGIVRTSHNMLSAHLPLTIFL